MASESQPLLGSVKRIRAIKDLVYQGKAIRGRRRTRIDGTLGAYDINIIEGEEFECDQDFAKEVCMSGKATLLSGGQVEVIPQADGCPVYQSWVRDPAAPAPLYERVELLKPFFFGDGCHLPIGSRIRLDLVAYRPTMLCYEDTERTDDHGVRVLKPSPKKMRVSQADQASKISAMWEKLFPAAAV